jgi:integrase
VIGKKAGPPIGDLLRLGLATGARLNELCELRVKDVKQADRTILIREGKTASATRIIPVLAAVWPIIERRVRTAKEGVLFSELAQSGPDQKRSWNTSKRFTKFRRRVLGESNEVDFHSLRRTFATYLEHAMTRSPKVNETVIDELMGHKKKTLALSVYSGGLRIQHLKDAIELLVGGHGAGGAGSTRWAVRRPEGKAGGMVPKRTPFRLVGP